MSDVLPIERDLPYVVDSVNLQGDQVMISFGVRDKIGMMPAAGMYEQIIFVPQLMPAELQAQVGELLELLCGIIDDASAAIRNGEVSPYVRPPGVS